MQRGGVGERGGPGSEGKGSKEKGDGSMGKCTV